MKNFEDRVMNCDQCSRLRSVTPIPYPHILFADTIEDARVMIVGRNPGLESSYDHISKSSFMETYKQRYMRCRFGRYLEMTFGSDIWKYSVVTNLVKCSSPENSKPTKEEIDNCLPYLKEQTRIFKPSVMAIFGLEAGIALFGEEFRELVKSERYVKSEKAALFGFYHPSYLLRSNLDWAIAYNEAKARKVMELIT